MEWGEGWRVVDRMRGTLFEIQDVPLPELRARLRSWRRWLVSCRFFFRGWDFVAALLGLGASPGRAVALGGLLKQIRRPALRTFFGDQLVPRCELALGITAASVEDLSAPAPPLQHLAFFTLGARHPRLHRIRL